MLKVFELSVGDNFKSLTPLNNCWDIITSIDFTRVSDAWSPIELEFFGKGKRGDCPYLLAGFLVFSEGAVDALNYLIEDSVEYLPLICPGKVKFWGVNIIKGLDCIDYNRADVDRFESSGRIMNIKKYAFKKEVLDGINIFKTPDYTGVVFVSEAFVNKVKVAGLEGLKFVELG